MAIDPIDTPCEPEDEDILHPARRSPADGAMAGAHPPPPPAYVTLELPAAVPCPAGCIHCSHRAATGPDGGGRRLTIDDAMAIARNAARLGATHFVAYPRSGDISLEPDRYAPLFSLARSLRLRTKSTSAAVDPDGLLRLVPHLSQLTLSVDGLDPETFSRFRPLWLLERVERFLDAFAALPTPPCRLAANMVLTRSLMASGAFARSLDEVVARGLFFKLNVLEILPGWDADFAAERLGPDEIAELRRIKAEYRDRIKITIPSWQRGTPWAPSCPLGRSFLVIGPGGEVSPCVMLLHGGLTVTHLNDEVSLETAWQHIRESARFRKARVELFKAPADFPHTSDLAACRKCSLFVQERCYGGCVARARLFGHECEIARQCGGPLP